MKYTMNSCPGLQIYIHNATAQHKLHHERNYKQIQSAQVYKMPAAPYNVISRTCDYRIFFKKYIYIYIYMCVCVCVYIHTHTLLTHTHTRKMSKGYFYKASYFDFNHHHSSSYRNHRFLEIGFIYILRWRCEESPHSG